MTEDPRPAPAPSRAPPADRTGLDRASSAPGAQRKGEVDRLLTTCDTEPIRIPGTIQPHGFLVGIDSQTWLVDWVSENLQAHIDVNAQDALGMSAADLLGRVSPDLLAQLKNVVLPEDLAMLQPLPVGGRCYNVTAFRSRNELVVEFELRDDLTSSLDTLYPQLRATVERIQSADDFAQLFEIVGAQVGAWTGFDRVLVYRFDKQWNGTVVAEQSNGTFASLLDLRFPASDIPAQARELYRTNRIRMIPDANYEPVPLLARRASAGALDLSQSVLRSVSPVHLQYMRNMGTPASMSFSILRDGQLWGLVSCHHSSPRRVPTHVRAACDFIVQVLGIQLAAKDRNLDAADRVARQNLHARLLGNMAQEQHFVDGLLRYPEPFMAIADAAGAAVVINGECGTVGQTPTMDEITDLVNWLADTHPNDEVFASDSLINEIPDAQGMAERASGVLAISISQIHRSYVLWFRPEQIQTVTWGGDPTKRDTDGSGRLSPRTSFEAWKETVRNQSAEWTTPQIETIEALRHSIIGIVMRNAEELADLSGELKRSNAELEAFSYSISHDLRAPFRHIVGYAELLREMPELQNEEQATRYITTIIESAHIAGELVDGLLGYSQTGRMTLSKRKVDMDALLNDTLKVLEPDLKDRKIEWEIGELGRAYGDPGMLRRVLQNLLSNAIKYTRTREVAVIKVAREVTDSEVIYSVSDNGVGFDMQYVGKLFGVFQRLHRMEEFEGTGIGLANVKRIAQRHGGRAWTQAELNRGATFYFSLPR